MALSDYIPNVFGQAAPSYLQGLLGAEETQNLQNRANVQGLLGAGLALAQGMSRTGPRRSAAENILGALAGGFGAAGGAYDQGIKNYVTQQQIAQTQLQQAQATNRLRAIQQASKDNPQLAQLFAINPEEASKQLIFQERAKRYQSLLGEPSTQPALSTSQTIVPSVVSVDQTMMPNANVSTDMPAPATSSTAIPEPTGQAQPKVQLVNPANVEKARRYRIAAQQATLEGDTATANIYYNEANRIDPPENITFRDGMAFSNKSGLIANFGGTKQLTTQEVKDKGLDPNKRYQVGMSGVITEIPTTAKVEQLTTEQANKEGLRTGSGQIYARLPNGEIKQIQGAITTILTPQQAKEKGLRTTEGQTWQVDSSGNYSIIQGTNIEGQLNKQQLIASLPTQANNVYPTLKPRFDALVARAPGLTADQINSEITSILDADSKILADLDPKLQAAEINRRKAGATVLYPVNSMPLGKEGANKVDTQLLDLGQSRLRLQSISANFNPKYLETPFQLRMTAVAELEKLGKKPSTQDAADLAAYSEFAQSAYNELNAYINLITGAAVGSGDEEARLRKGVPDPQKDSPTQFLTKLNTKIKEGRLYEARLGYIKNKGMKITDAGLVDVNQIPTMMRNREAEIKNNKKLFGNQEYNAKDPNHKAIVRSILSKEFGLVD
jgi:hypothetical protein